MPPADARRTATWIAVGACAFAGLMGALGLLGWTADLRALTRIRPSLPSMMPLAAVMLLVSAVSASCLCRSRIRLAGRIAALVGGVGVALCSFVTIGHGIWGWQPGFGRVLFDDKLPADVSGYPSHYVAACLLFLGLAIMFLAIDPKRVGSAQALAVVGGLVAGLALEGHIIRYPNFYRTPSGSGMALHTAVAGIALAIGVIFARPGGLMTMLVSPDLSGTTARRLLPLPLFLSGLLSWLGLEGGRAGLYSGPVGIWLLQLSNLVFFTLLIWTTCDLLRHREMENASMLKALQDSEQRFRSIFEDGPLGMALWSLDQHLIQVNPALCKLLGYDENELLRLTLHDFAESREESTKELANQLESDLTSSAIEQRSIRKDQQVITLIRTTALVRDSQSVPIYGVALYQDITPRKMAERLAEDRTRALEVANRELEAFTYSVSHDLRAPLRHIDGFSELLHRRGKDKLDETLQRYVRMIAQSAKEMGNLIDDLLAFSRMGKADLRETRIDVGELVREVVRAVTLEAQGRNVDWQIGELGIVSADPAMLKLVFVNLLSNALKYTRGRPTATVEVARYESGDEAVYLVRDNGVGFDSKYLPKLFGVFQRLHSNDEFEGTGIGLANVRRIVHRHGGRTWAEGAVDAGATFFFSLPNHIEVTNRERSEVNCSG